jgi:hypothetical protein
MNKATAPTQPPGPTTVVTAAPDMFLKFDGVRPTESFSLNFTKVE